MDKYSDKGAGTTVVWEYWRKSNGGSELAWHYFEGYSDVGKGHAQRFDFINVPEDRGRWMQIVIHFKASSSNGVADGIIETYRRWADETEFTRYHYSDSAVFSLPNDVNYAGWRQGYFMGWSNVKWEERTHWLIDGVEFSETPLLDVTGIWNVSKPSKAGVAPFYVVE